MVLYDLYRGYEEIPAQQTAPVGEVFFEKHNITVLSINDWWKGGQEEIGGYIVHCPALKGCWSQGDTGEEALQNIKEAIAGYLKTLNERAILDVKIQSKVQIREVAVA